ncbi:hypothetical protein E2C01_029686 [Portunus trituberculatus]|uniref:Uncharacterized protein n=1 Tax=Portunus trituberculatus TaxID=210409 RepID=A0A5B7ESL8_PORTR|nr:hypothetical protein [Portunus trituberculatus]
MKELMYAFHFCPSCIKGKRSAVEAGGEEQSDTSQDPLSRLLFGLEVEGPDIGWSSLARLVKRTLIQVPVLCFVLCNGLGKKEQN